MNKAGEEASLHVRALVATHGHEVESLLAILEHDRATREDLWSEVFTTAYVRIDQLVDLSPDQARGWLRRTAHNLAANTARRSSTRRRLVTRLTHDPVPTMPSAEDTYLEGSGATDDEELAAVRRACEQLPDNQQRVLHLDALGYDGPSMARALGITDSAARSRLMRARRAFLDVYRPHEGAPR